MIVRLPAMCGIALFLALWLSQQMVATAEEPGHWAFQPIQRPAVPEVAARELVRTPVDAFILAEQEARGLTLSPPADRRTLVRRLSLNLWGLPPSPEIVQQFVGDESSEAYDRLIERMLSSPHYGERWARHWLDVARFAESSGYVENNTWPHFWRYRDWVVQSLNDDKPFDEFVTQQLAGDELEPYADENIIATGFLAAARLATEELSCIRQENDMYVDIVNAVSSAFMGLTMACAQCHDHMFDPLTERDYYRLQAFFTQGYPGNLVLQSSQVPDEFHELARQLTEQDLKVRSRILGEGYDELPEPERRVMHTPPADRTPEEEALYRVRRAEMNIRIGGCNAFRITEEEKKELDRLKAELARHEAKVVQTWGFYSPVTSPHRLSTLPMAGNFPLSFDVEMLASRRCYLLHRGDPYQPQETISPGFPQVLNPDSVSVPEDRPRTALARWLTDTRHPLTARVWVNRIWAYHFGQGIVATPSNFGTRGVPPTHPELLDYLASELRESGWSTKHVQRLILKSSTYQQSAAHNEQAAQVDPENQLYWRWPRRRLEAEAIRDMMLATTGELDRSLGGPSAPPETPSPRRSLYVLQKRDQPYDVAKLFDGPTEMAASCAERQVSTSAVQPLYLLNSPRIVALSEALAKTIAEKAPADPKRQINLLFERVLGRAPASQEEEASLAYLQFARQEQGSAPHRPRVTRLDIASAPDAPAAPPESILRSGEVSDYVLHYNGFADHTPDLAQGTVTYYFDSPETVAEVEVVVHVNGISRIEGFVGDDANQLQSIGEAGTAAAGRGKPFPGERGAHVFRFAHDRIRPGQVFRLVVKETCKADGYANFQAFPRTSSGRRILPALELVPDAPQPMSSLAKLCQAMLNLNEFFYVP